MTKEDLDQFVPTKNKRLPPTQGKGRACSARFMARFRKFVKEGKSVEDITSEYCFSKQEVYQLRAALKTKEKIEQKVNQFTSEMQFDTDFDAIPPTHYIMLSRLTDADKQVELACRVSKEHLTVEELRNMLPRKIGTKPKNLIKRLAQASTNLRFLATELLQNWHELGTSDIETCRKIVQQFAATISDIEERTMPMTQTSMDGVIR